MGLLGQLWLLQDIAGHQANNYTPRNLDMTHSHTLTLTHLMLHKVYLTICLPISACNFNFGFITCVSVLPLPNSIAPLSPPCNPRPPLIVITTVGICPSALFCQEPLFHTEDTIHYRQIFYPNRRFQRRMRRGHGMSFTICEPLYITLILPNRS